MNSGIRAFIVGYTGESGKELVKACINDSRYSKLILIGRRKVDLPSSANGDASKCEQVQVDYDKLEDSADSFADCTVGYCCLGTTRAKSGVEGFIKVDRDYILKVAEISKTAGCSEFHLISSKGANAQSTFLYPRIKGEVDSHLMSCGWFKKVVIYRPGVLMCDRTESRVGERIVRACLRPVAWMAPTAITTYTDALARAMIHATFNIDASPPEPLGISDIYNMSKPTTDSKPPAS